MNDRAVTVLLVSTVVVFCTVLVGGILAYVLYVFGVFDKAAPVEVTIKAGAATPPLPADEPKPLQSACSTLAAEVIARNTLPFAAAAAFSAYGDTAFAVVKSADESTGTAKVYAQRRVAHDASVSFVTAPAPLVMSKETYVRGGYKSIAAMPGEALAIVALPLDTDATPDGVVSVRHPLAVSQAVGDTDLTLATYTPACVAYDGVHEELLIAWTKSDASGTSVLTTHPTNALTAARLTIDLRTVPTAIVVAAGDLVVAYNDGTQDHFAWARASSRWELVSNLAPGPGYGPAVALRADGALFAVSSMAANGQITLYAKNADGAFESVHTYVNPNPSYTEDNTDSFGATLAFLGDTLYAGRWGNAVALNTETYGATFWTDLGATGDWRYLDAVHTGKRGLMTVLSDVNGATSVQLVTRCDVLTG